MAHFLIKYPPAVSVPLFYTLTTIYMVARFFFGTVFGLLLLSLGIYMIAGWFGLSPLSANHLMLWIDGLTPEYKTALFTSLITIAGFVIAFHAATTNWRDQFNAQMKSQIAGEIEGFFGPLSVSINKVSFYAQSLGNAVNEIQGGASLKDAGFSIGYLQGQQDRFLAARDHISQAASEVHRIIGRNYNVLSAGWGVLPQMQLTAAALKELSEAIWIRLPVVDMNNPNHIQSFINQVNVAQCLALVKSCEDNGSKLAGLTGGIRGYLLAPIVGFNFAMFANLISNAKEFRKVITELYGKVNRDG